MSRIGFGGVVIGYLVLVLVLGGASAAGFIGNAVLQVIGAAIIGWCIAVPDAAGSRMRTGLHPLGIAMLVLVGIQFLPLPPFVWAALPGRDVVANGYLLLGQPLPWQPLSLSPWSSLAVIVWWIPAVALGLALLRPNAPSSTAIARTVTSVAVVSIAFGSMQRAGGQLYFYTITNYGLGTGFFANANHQASFLLCAIALWGANFSGQRASGFLRDRQEVGRALFLGVLALLVIGVILSNSQAGIGLLVPVLGGVLLINRPAWRPSRPVMGLGLAAVVGCVGAFGVWGQVGASLGKVAGDAGQNRFDYNSNGLALLRDTWPFGTGLGTFQDIYHWYEKPSEVNNVFVNHAHNDLLEILIETGLFGVVALGLFLLWWSRHAWAKWGAARGNSYALGATLLTGVVLAHSLVDYPLRTAAISSLFALGCIMMMRPEPLSRRARERSKSSDLHDLVAI